MAFTLEWFNEARDTYAQIEQSARASHENRKRTGKSKSTKAEGLFKQIAKTARLLAENPKHPGLNTHEYDSLENPYDSNQKVFEAYVQNRTPGAYRMFWCYGPDPGKITIIAITPHP